MPEEVWRLVLALHLQVAHLIGTGTCRGTDLYSLAFARAVGIPIDEVTPSQRRFTKMVTFHTVCTHSTLQYSASLKSADFDDLRQRWFDAHPELMAIHTVDRVHSDALAGYEEAMQGLPLQEESQS